MEPEGSLPHSQVPATCPYPEPARSSPHPQHPTSWKSVLILPSHLHLGLPGELFPSGFPTKTLYMPLFFPYTRYKSRPSNSSRFDHPNNIGWGVQIIQLLISGLIHAIIQYQPAGKNNTGRFLQSFTDWWSETVTRPVSSGAWWY